MLICCWELLLLHLRVEWVSGRSLVLHGFKKSVWRRWTKGANGVTIVKLLYLLETILWTSISVVRLFPLSTFRSVFHSPSKIYRHLLCRMMSGFVLYVSDVDLEPIKLNSSKTTAVFDATFIWRFCKKVIVCNSYKHIYLDKYSSGLGFRIRILTILAWSNSGVSVANNLYINTHQTRCFLGRKLIYNVNYIQGVFTILFGVEKTRTQVCNLNHFSENLLP